MKKFLTLLVGLPVLAAFLFLNLNTAFAQDAYQVGDQVEDFLLPAVSGAEVSLANYEEAKGVIVVFTVPMLDRMKIDDVVGAIPVHLFAGIWGTLAVAFYHGNWGAQITGIIAYGVFTFVIGLVVWIILKGIMGIRVSEEAEINGLDTTELGMEAYPDFSKG